MVGFSDEKFLTFVESRMHLAIEIFERLKRVRDLFLPSLQLDIYEKLKASSKVDLPGDLTYRHWAASAATTHFAVDRSTASRDKNSSSLLVTAYMPFFLDYSKLRESSKQQNRRFDFFWSFSTIRCF